MTDPTGQPLPQPPWSTAPAEVETRAFPATGPEDPTRPYSSQPPPYAAPPPPYAAPPPYGGPSAPPGPQYPSQVPYQPTGGNPPPGYPPPGYPPPGPYQPPGTYPPPGPYQPPAYGSGWGPPPPSGFPPPGSLPPRRRAPSAFVLVLVLLLVVATITGATAWYLLLFQPGASTKPSTSPDIAVASPAPTRTPTPRPSPRPTATPPPTPTAAATVAPSIVASTTAAPSAQASSSPVAGSPSAPSGSSAPASIDPAVVAQIDAIVAQVPAIRGLEPTRKVPYRFITRDQFAAQFQSQFAQDNPPAQLAAEEALEKHLGLLPPDADLAALATQLYTSQVLAFYDPTTKDFTVIQQPGSTFSQADEVTVAHEYDHALQDQHWDLQKLEKVDPSEGDRAAAITALAEGDATDVMEQWAIQNLTFDQMATLGGSVTPEDQQLLDSMPLVLRYSLQFPYLSGFFFVATLQGSGGWDAVNAAWDKPPVSTEQIMHPEKYQAGDQPITVTLPDVASKLGTGWTAATTETEGELDTGIWLADGVDNGTGPLGLPAPLPNANAAAGWGGDRLVSLNGPDGTWAVVWQTAWDTPQDATEFSVAATTVMADLPGSHVVAASSIAGNVPSPELVLVASDAATLTTVQAALGVGG